MDLTGEKILPESFGHLDLDKLIPEIYAELKRLAAYYLRSERPNHTLQPTELVHEVYLQMLKQHSVDLDNRQQFIGLASLLMRRVLVDYAKSRNSLKRNSGKEKVSFDDIENKTIIEIEQNQIELLALDEVLNDLEKRDVRQVKIVEMHFFGGLTFQEIADILGISLRSVMRDWDFARSWLYRQLKS